MRLDAGEERTTQWLEELKANDPKFYEKNTPIVEAVASGEIELGLVNHYYLYLVKEEQPDAPIANHYLPGDDPGALVSVAGVGVLDERRARGRRASGSSSSCSPTSSSASTPRRPRRPRSRSSTGSRRRRACRRSTSSPTAARTSTSPRFGAELETDARAAERDRLHVVSRGRRGRAPLSPPPARRRHRRAAAAPARLPRRARGRQQPRPGTCSWRANTLELIWSTGLLVAGVTAASVTIGVSLAWLVTRTDLPGRRLWAVAAALPLVIPSYVAAFCLLGAFGPRGLLQQLLGVERLPEIYGYWGALAALTLSTYPVRAPARLGRAARARPVARGGRPRPRPDAVRGLPAGDAARAAAVDRRRRAARRALHALGLRRRLADAVRRAHPGHLPPVPLALRPDARRACSRSCSSR